MHTHTQSIIVEVMWQAKINLKAIIGVLCEKLKPTINPHTGGYKSLQCTS